MISDSYLMGQNEQGESDADFINNMKMKAAYYQSIGLPTIAAALIDAADYIERERKNKHH